MKIKLNIEIDVPNAENYSDEGLRQILFDRYINYVTCAHLRDWQKWLFESYHELNGQEYTSNAEKISDIHKTWGEICGQAKFTYERME